MDLPLPRAGDTTVCPLAHGGVEPLSIRGVFWSVLPDAPADPDRHSCGSWAVQDGPLSHIRDAHAMLPGNLF